MSLIFLIATSLDINGLLHGLAGAIVTGGVTLAIWYFNRAKPIKVVCGILSASPTVTIDRGVQTDVEVIYKGVPVKSLAILELVIFNNAATTVEKLDLAIELPQMTRVLEFEFPNPRAAENVATVTKDGESKLRIQAAYLNSLWAHGDKLLLKLVCDGDVNSLTVHGRGHGWSVEKENLTRSSSEFWGMILMIASILFVAICAAFFSEVAKANLHPALVSTLFIGFMLGAMIVGMALPSHFEVKKMRRLRG